MEILVPILILGGLGLIFGGGLAMAAKKFCVVTDPKVEKIFAKLPGANCGACGKPGCFGFVESLVRNECGIDSCRVLEDEAKEEISAILGVKLQKRVKTVAVLHCNGGSKVKDRFEYRGIKDCVSANLVLGGQKACVYGCLGFGTCEKACPFGAITMNSEGLPVVNEKKCRACNRCVEVCPKELFSLIPITGEVHVACMSRDIGKDTKAACPVGCIACKLCEKACKFDAIHVIDNLAVIDYTKCTSCGECVKVCPMKTIHIKK